MTIAQLFLGELAIWLAALAFWLWPAEVRHRVMWAVWCWLHPEPVRVGVPRIQRQSPNVLNPVAAMPVLIYRGAGIGPSFSNAERLVETPAFGLTRSKPRTHLNLIRDTETGDTLIRSDAWCERMHMRGEPIS